MNQRLKGLFSALQDIHDFFEASDLVVCYACGRRPAFRGVIEENGAKACLVGSCDICVEIITHHNGFLGLGTSKLEGVLEELGAGLVGSSIF